MSETTVRAMAEPDTSDHGNKRFQVFWDGKHYDRTHTIDDADELARAILDGGGIPDIYDHLTKRFVMLAA